MKIPVFLCPSQQKLLEDSTLAISFADFSGNFIKNPSILIRDIIQNAR